MLAYHNDPKIKKLYLDRVKAHAAADELIQGTGWENGRGCAVGCTLHDYNHAKYETELGVPMILARLQDLIFEGLYPLDAKAFPQKFLSAIHIGADLSLVWPKFAVWLLCNKRHGVIQYAKSGAGKKAIRDVADLYEKTIAGDVVTTQDWRAAYARAAAARAAVCAADAAAAAAAYDAAYDAADADAAAAAAAAAAAYDAAYAAAAVCAAADAYDAAYDAADAAAAAAADAAAARAARAKSYKAQGEYLIYLLKHSKSS